MKLKLYLEVTGCWSQGSNSCKWTGHHAQNLRSTPVSPTQAKYLSIIYRTQVNPRRRCTNFQLSWFGAGKASLTFKTQGLLNMKRFHYILQSLSFSFISRICCPRSHYQPMYVQYMFFILLYTKEGVPRSCTAI